LPHLPRRRLGKARDRQGREKPVYLLVSHHHLEKRRLVARLKRRHDAVFVCLIHDLIPIQFPEYVRPGHDKRHLRRIDTAANLADAVIVPSQATREAVRPYIASNGGAQPIIVAPFGVESSSIVPDEQPLAERPYFVCLGTVEARKNHLLLLNLWRDIVGQNAERAPGLVLIGRRGWEIENAIDMLSRCPALHGIVSERGRASDIETVRILKNARALLLPSYAEGFGFPLIEALASGNPVLCSDLPALREIGGAIPEYFDPLDGNAWRAAILDYAYDPSPRREAQLQRLSKWRAPCWSDHFAAVEALVADIRGAAQ
jgi:glycosyltransferase involved in cell wall biosynthesis